MEGIEKITAKIAADTQAEINALTARAREEAAAISSHWAARAAALTVDLAEEGRRAAARREEQIASAARLEARNLDLAARQELLDAAFDRALDKLCSLEDAPLVDLLAALMVKASRTGREQAAFCHRDRNRVGKAAVAKANELLAKSVAPKLPEELADTRVGAFVDRVVSGVSARAQGTAMLTMAEESRSFRGGCVLIDGKVETNCSFEALLRPERTAMAGEVARILFG